MESIDDFGKHFLEETNLLFKPNVALVVGYGSRENKTSNHNSDYDVLVVLSNNFRCRAAIMVDGVHVDIHVLTIDDVLYKLEHDIRVGNVYLKSVLLNGRVLYDSVGLYEEFLSCLDDEKKYNRKMDAAYVSSFSSKFDEFVNSGNNDDVLYYSALEVFRRLVHVNMKASNVSELKVYKLYTDLELAKKYYSLTMPSEEFIQDYLHSLEIVDYKNRVDRLRYLLLKYLPRLNLKLYYYHFDTINPELKMVSLNNLVCKVEELLISANPYGVPLYFLALNDLKEFISLVDEVKNNEWEILYESAKHAKSVDDKIKCLEDLFAVVDFLYKIDYDNFILRY